MYKDSITKDLILEYEGINAFVNDYKSLNYIEFDYYTVNKVNLFSMNESFDFDLLETFLNKIIDTLPAIKRIFAKPLIHLKDDEIVLPVESVHKIDYKTIANASCHSELWENINADGTLKPRKLLTKMNVDNYSIYENKVFKYCIDFILSYVNSNYRILREIMYNNRSLSFNLLDRLDHIDYYLALGKLHTGYIRNFEKNYSLIERNINKIQYLINVISSRLNKNVYKKNKDVGLSSNLILRKTNILKMHKDYHQIYNLLKYFESNKIEVKEDISFEQYLKLYKNYSNYVGLISIFSIGHFNFEIDDKKRKLNLQKIDGTFTFKKWTINVKKVSSKRVDGYIFTVKANKEYSFMIVPCVDKEEDGFEIQSLIYENKVDEVVLASPLENEGMMYLSISNVDSFRRVQQKILKAMIYVDNKHDICPFCGNKMEKHEGSYECKSCRTIINKAKCPKRKRIYYTTSIRGYTPSVDIDKRMTESNIWLINKEIEASMHFRNVTKIDSKGNPICPFCNEVEKIS